MKRRFNYTGRVRVPQKTIAITLGRDSHGEIEFFKAVINLTEFQLPSTAKVFVEAYYRTEQHRYDFGTVSNIMRPEDTSLSGLAYTENLKFRVLVVDNTGKILAAADRIKPVGEVEEPLLPVEFDDSLEKQIWRLAYIGEENAPVLQVNKKIPGIENVLHSPEFIFHVYPSVLREVLTHIIFIDTLTDQEEPDTEWQEKWLKFASATLGEQPPNLCKNSNNNFDKDQAEKWIKNVVEEFCASRDNWKEFVDRFTVISNDEA